MCRFFISMALYQVPVAKPLFMEVRHSNKKHFKKP